MFFDRAYDLLSRAHLAAVRRKIAVGDMQIRRAEAARLDPDEHLVGTQASDCLVPGEAPLVSRSWPTPS
jgi:hypothetical protein